MDCIGFLHYLLLFTIVFAIYGLSWKIRTHRYVLLILGTFLINETISIICNYFHLTFRINFSITTLIHDVLWLLILRKSVSFPKVLVGLLIAFTTFCFCDLFFIEGWRIFNTYTFILGAFLYLIMFLVESFQQLRKENFSFFFSNQFILLMTPVLFFIGLTFMFGFRSKAINATVFFEKFQLYQTIIILVNLVYYILLNIYIYREKKKLYEF